MVNKLPLFGQVIHTVKRPSLRETAKNEKAKMADQYETYIDGNYSRRDNYWQNSKFFGGL